MAFFNRAAAAAALSINAGTVSTVASRHALLRGSSTVSSSRFHTSIRSSAAAPKEAVKDAVKSAAASTASAAISNKAQKIGGQAVASARETASIAANTPPPVPKVTPASIAPTTSSSWSSSSSGRKRGGGPLSSALNATLFLVGGTLLFFYYRDSRAAIHRWIAIPALKALLDPESAQKLAIDLLASGVAPIDVVPDDELLKTELFGMTLSNPLGLAAGFDKQAQAIDGLFDLGFGIVEVGSVTPEPQPGNPQPRYFRLLADDAAINRFGFNSDGHATVLSRLRTRIDRWLLATDALAPVSSSSGSSDSASGALESRTSVTTIPHTSEQLPELIELDAEAALIRAGEVNPRASSGPSRLSLRPDRLLSINLGKNKTTAESQAVRDYILGIHALGPYADMLVVNISSPNTPGLRDLQRAEVLGNLLKELVKARDDMVHSQQKLAAAVSCPVYHPSSSGEAAKPKQPEFKVPLVLKISPDLSESELDDIAEAVKMAKVDGLIVSNTTVQRPRTLLTSTVHNDPVVEEAGGLSGRPLKPLSLRALRHLSARLREDKIPLIGCGGIFSGADALEFAKAGASAVQIYTSFGYTGVGAPRRIKDELLELLKKEGKSWQQLVGSDASTQ
ncbi:Dihydroorotate dehydrogenase (quinone), mitochondrial [Tilletia horrida]|nr:Dihydroorotate dehydrogenase (quinone), mitochondrial [Tilletia horrida]KAK0569840.1 Dihydroorotate dehydrogenase (quinone), mitochondrial [Tilletia horrida]